MAGRNFRICALIEVVAVCSFVLGVVTVASPYWARFDNGNKDSLSSGGIGLWTVCPDRLGTAYCVSQFNGQVTITAWDYIAGVMASVGVASLGVASVLGVLLLLMLRTERRVCLPYRPAVVARLLLVVLAVLMSATALALHVIRDNPAGGAYRVTFGWAFYVHNLLLISETALVCACAYDLLLSRRLGGDPTFFSRDPTGASAHTYANPSFTTEERGVLQSSAPTNGTTTNHKTTKTTNHNHNHSSIEQRNGGSSSSSSSRASGRRIQPTTGRLAAARAAQAAAGQRSSAGHKRPSVSVTATSGDPYLLHDAVDRGSLLNGSFESSHSTISSVTNSSVLSNPMSPRKSSLKKPRAFRPPPELQSPGGGGGGGGDAGDAAGLGFQNPNFAECRASMKRVRINIGSTDV